MELNNINLSAYGYSDTYSIDEKGIVYKNDKPIRLKRDNIYSIKNKNNLFIQVSLKTIYRQVFNKEYCIDNIQNLNGEEWKPIDTEQRYYVSNYGRIKSLCQYKAIILKPCKDRYNYLYVKLYKKNVYIHRLVAFSFADNREEYKDKKVDIHHKDKNRQNNNINNLMILTPKEHQQIHNKKEQKQ